MSEWISVKDRLPDVFGEYLVASIDRGYVGESHYDPDHNEWSAEYFDESTISHWMEYPEPPIPKRD